MSAKTNEPKTIRNSIFRFLRVFGLGYGILLGALVLFETRLVYPGAFSQPGTVTSAPDVVELVYTSEDDVQLAGRLLRHPAAEHCVVYFHGNGVRTQNLDGRLRHLSQTLKATVFAPEYRGFQPDTGSPYEQAVLMDGLAGFEAIQEHLNKPAEEFVLYGRSLGGAVAVEAARDKGCQCLVLERTFDRMVDVAAAKYPAFPCIC